MKIHTVNNSIIINRVIGGKSFSAETKKIDETRTVLAKGINKIKVDSSLADVTIAVGNRTDVEVHYYGEVCTDGEFKFDVTTFEDEVIVSAKVKGNFFNGRLKLDVLIPQKLFKLISVESQNGRTDIYQNVEAERIKINLQNGRIKSIASFKEIIAKSMNGSIYIMTRAKNDIEISAKSMNGNVSVELENIGFCNISTSSMNGSAKNMHNSIGEYKAIGNVSSMNGNVVVM